ncbi:MAG: phage baseplate assembly protein V [Oscillospiraceae bacterium]
MNILDYVSGEDKTDIPLLSGVCPAVVTNINDPDKLGRVKVKLLILDLPDYETDFIRVATPMSGASWGMLFFPNVGDEVLVAFCGGDISRAYVIGSLWNKNFKTPVEIEEKNPIRMIQTKAGHKLVFDDTDGKEKITVSTKGELSVTMDDEKQKITLKDKGGKNLVIIDSQNGTITITAEKKVNISAGSTKIILEDSGNLSASADSSVRIKSSKLTLKGDNTEVTASGSLKLSSDGQTAVKGAAVKIN